MTALAELPDALVRAIRLADAAPELRVLLSRLPRKIGVSITLPLYQASRGDAPTAMLTMLKLATLGLALALSKIELSTDPNTPAAIRFSATRAEPSPSGLTFDITGAQLAGDAMQLCLQMFQALLEPADFSHMLSGFSRETAKLSAQKAVLRHMLLCESSTQALEVLLSGVTAGHGFGFHRAALFSFDEAQNAFVGIAAVGPKSEADAHRIWEAIEYDDEGFESLLAQSKEPHEANDPFRRLVQSLQLPPQLHEVHLAETSALPRVFAVNQHTSPALSALDLSGEYILASLRPAGRATVRGLLFADQRYLPSGSLISRDLRIHGTWDARNGEFLSLLGFSLEQSALVWNNLELLARVEQLARFDSLTGVLNRRALEERFSEERARALRSNGFLSLLLLDLDKFKQINDERGHAAGDDLLRRLGELLRSDFRQNDWVGRIGGDEFAVVLPEASREDAMRIAARFSANARREGISVSIGGANWPTDVTEPESLFLKADAALYQAKRAGRDVVRFPVEKGIR